MSNRCLCAAIIFKKVSEHFPQNFSKTTPATLRTCTWNHSKPTNNHHTPQKLTTMLLNTIPAHGRCTSAHTHSECTSTAQLPMHDSQYSFYHADARMSRSDLKSNKPHPPTCRWAQRAFLNCLWGDVSSTNAAEWTAGYVCCAAEYASDGDADELAFWKCL